MSCFIEVSNCLVRLFVLRILLEELLIGSDCFLGLGNIFGRLDAWTILSMDRPRDKHRSGFVIWIQLGSPARMLLSVREVAFTIRFRGLIQLEIGRASCRERV